MSTQWLEQTSKDITNQQGAYTNKETPLYSRRTRKAISFDDEEEVDDTQLCIKTIKRAMDDRVMMNIELKNLNRL